MGAPEVKDEGINFFCGVLLFGMLLEGVLLGGVLLGGVLLGGRLMCGEKCKGLYFFSNNIDLNEV